MLDYHTFLRGKRATVPASGISALGKECNEKCGVAGTMVPTEDGLKPIGELQPPNSDLGLSPLHVKVQTPYGAAETSHFYNSGHNPTRRVTTRMGYQVAGTYVHPLLILDRDGVVKWRRLQDIQRGDFVAVQRHGGLFGRTTQLPSFDYVRKGNYGASEKAIAVGAFRSNHGILTKSTLSDIRTKLGRNVSHEMVRKWSQQGTDYTPGNVTTPTLPTHLTEDLAYTLGVIVGDGCLRGGPPVIGITTADDEIAIHIRNWATSLNMMLIQTSRPIQYEIRSVALKLWLFKLGLSSGLAHVKITPHVILSAPKECVRAFLQGLFDTDGSASKRDGGVEFCSASESLARQVHLLLLQFGIISRLRFKANSKHGAWIIQMFGAEARKFYECVGFRLTRKQERSSSLPATHNTNIDVIPHLPKVKWIDRRRDFRNCQIGIDCPSYTKLRRMAAVYPELSTLLEPEYFWDKVEEVVDNGIVPTYDLTVPGPLAFVANGIVNHNTCIQIEEVGA